MTTRKSPPSASSQNLARRALAVLAEPPNRDGVSVGFLARRLGAERRRLRKTVALLARSGYVRVRRVGRVELVSLTLPGYERGAVDSKPSSRRASPGLKLAGAGLLALLIGFLWWWDLFPEADGWQRVQSAPLPSATALSASTETPTPEPLPPTPARGETATPRPSATPSPTAGPLLPTAIPVDTPIPEALTREPLPTPVPLVEQDPHAVNVLLMGADSSDGSWRTDTLILVSVDPRLPSVSLLSIPRDLYLYIPGWRMSRVNTADFHGRQVGYPGGGPGLVKATLAYNLGIGVHYYARVDFQGFVEILDTLGGVEVLVDCELHDTFPDPAAEDGRRDIDLLPGLHHLDGQEALWYARSRWNTSDFDRGRRQQRVLRAALSRIKQLELLPQLPALWDDLTATVETDLSLESALWLARVAGRLAADTAIKSRFIDATVTEQWLTPGGGAVLLPVYERTAPLIAEALAPPETARARQGLARVEVLNGTAWPDWALLAADRLAWEGFQVVHVGPAERDDYQQTTVVDLSGAEKGSPAAYLARVLGVQGTDVVPAQEAQAGIDLRVIVGRDYRPCYKSYWRRLHGPTATPGP